MIFNKTYGKRWVYLVSTQEEVDEAVAPMMNAFKTQEMLKYNNLKTVLQRYFYDTKNRILVIEMVFSTKNLDSSYINRADFTTDDREYKKNLKKWEKYHPDYPLQTIKDYSYENYKQRISKQQSYVER